MENVPEQPSAEQMEFQQFLAQISSVWTTIADVIKRSQKERASEWYELSDHWRDTQEQLRTVAEELMLCADVKETLLGLQKDRLLWRVLAILTFEIRDEDYAKITRNAFVSRPLSAVILPGQAFATMLLAVANLQPEEVEEYFGGAYDLD